MHVSIVMPYYNAAAYIRETVEAIIAQTYKDWELIIVDDCSPAPETAEVLNQVKSMDDRIKINPCREKWWCRYSSKYRY